MNNARLYGLPPAAVAPVDFGAVANRIREVIGTIQHHDSVQRFHDLGVKVRFGHPRFTDERTIDLDGRRITAKTWVLATGSSATIPPLEGLDRTPFLTNREIFTLERLPRELIILGGGPIAIEMAQAFQRLGSKVKVIQRSDQILSKEDRDLADTVRQVLAGEGVEFHLGCSLKKVADQGGRREVTIETAEGEVRVVSGTDLLVALGRSVNIEGLDLERIGIACDRQGVKVDQRLRTAQKHIFAAGDVIGGYQFTHAAGYEGGIVLSNAVFHLPRKTDYTWMPWCTFTAPELASIGHNEKSARRAGLEFRVWTEEFRANDRAQAEGEKAGRIKLLLDRRNHPLGVQILGPHAGDLLGEWVAVLNGGVKLSGLAGAIHPYPTLAEINKKVVGSIYGEKLFSEKVKKILRFLFKYQGRAT
jgi:pyruvate/2-oxoglutarate dehydrogenase complex dihydrolipoamide dehydrogenase (E3) component